MVDFKKIDQLRLESDLKNLQNYLKDNKNVND